MMGVEVRDLVGDVIMGMREVAQRIELLLGNEYGG